MIFGAHGQPERASDSVRSQGLNERTLERPLALHQPTAPHQPSLFDRGSTDITARKHGGNPESAAAHRKIAESKAESRNRVLAFAVSRGALGITTDEVAEHFNVPPNAVSGRISELKVLGKLIPTDRRRPTRSGCSARVLVAG